MNNQNPPRLPSLDTLFSGAWHIYKSRFWSLIAIYLIPVLISIVFLMFVQGPFLSPENLSGIIQPKPNQEPATAGAGAIIAVFILSVAVMAVAFILGTLALVYEIKDGAGVVESYKSAFKKFWSYLWLAIISTLVILGGFALAIIPGIIFSIWFMFTLFVLAYEDKRGFSALLQSKEYVRGYWWAVFGRILLLTLIVWVIGFAFSLVLGFAVVTTGEQSVNLFSYAFQILLTPFFLAYTYVLYRQLADLKPGLSLPVPQKKGFFVFCAILGVIAPILVGGVLYYWVYFLIPEYLEKNPDFLKKYYENYNLELNTGSGDFGPID